MMFPGWLRAGASGKVVVGSLAIWMASAAVLFTAGPYNAVRSAGDATLLEERFGYTPSEAFDWLQRLGHAGRETYWNFQWFDSVNAILMAIALTLSLAFTLGRLTSERNWVRLAIFLPALALLSELVENVLLLILLSQFPNVSAGTVNLAAAITAIKLAAGFTALPVVLLSYLALGIQVLRSRLAKNRKASEIEGV